MEIKMTFNINIEDLLKLCEQALEEENEHFRKTHQEEEDFESYWLTPHYNNNTESYLDIFIYDALYDEIMIDENIQKIKKAIVDTYRKNKK